MIFLQQMKVLLGTKGITTICIWKAIWKKGK